MLKYALALFLVVAPAHAQTLPTGLIAANPKCPQGASLFTDYNLAMLFLMWSFEKITDDQLIEETVKVNPRIQPDAVRKYINECKGIPS